MAILQQYGACAYVCTVLDIATTVNQMLTGNNRFNDIPSLLSVVFFTFKYPDFELLRLLGRAIDMYDPVILSSS